MALGTTSVMYEGTPDYPDKDRLWDIVERNEVDIFYTAPTAIRAFMKWGAEYTENHDISSLRLLGTVGSQSTRARGSGTTSTSAMRSARSSTPGGRRKPGMMITTLPGVNTMKPGSAGPPLPGIDARVVDAQGEEVDAGQAGYVTVNNPGPACFARCTTTTSGSSRSTGRSTPTRRPTSGSTSPRTARRSTTTTTSPSSAGSTT